jgi:chromosome segregation ATPase
VTQPGPGDQQPGAQGPSTPYDGDLLGELARQVAESGRQITDKENQIKSLEHEVTQLKSGNASLTAFHEELKATVSELGQARNRATGERDSARKVVPLAKELAGRLAPDHVRAIDRAVDAVEGESEQRRSEVDRRRQELAQAIAAEIGAKADVSSADAALEEAKRRLGDLAKAVDAQAARVRGLRDAAQDAESKEQDSLAYLLVRDLEAALGNLDKLLDPERPEALQRDAKSAWDRQAAAAEAESDATWAAEQAKEALKEAEDAVAAHDKERRKEIERRVDEAEDSAPASGAPAAGATP